MACLSALQCPGGGGGGETSALEQACVRHNAENIIYLGMALDVTSWIR